MWQITRRLISKRGGAEEYSQSSLYLYRGRGRVVQSMILYDDKAPCNQSGEEEHNSRRFELSTHTLVLICTTREWERGS